jgi:hypothetical protein
MRTSTTGLLSVSMHEVRGNPAKQLSFAEDIASLAGKKRHSRIPSARQQILETIHSEGISSSQESFTPIAN